LINQVPSDEFQHVCQWAHLSTQDIAYAYQSKSLTSRCLTILIQAIAVKQTYLYKYPTSVITYIEYDGTGLDQDTKEWILVDGLKLKEFEARKK
jgi:hypothetical protein